MKVVRRPQHDHPFAVLKESPEAVDLSLFRRAVCWIDACLVEEAGVVLAPPHNVVCKRKQHHEHNIEYNESYADAFYDAIASVQNFVRGASIEYG